MSRASDRKKWAGNPEKLAELERSWKLRDEARARLKEEKRSKNFEGASKSRERVRAYLASGKLPLWANFVDKEGDYGGRATFSFILRVQAGEVGEPDPFGVRWFPLKNKPGRLFRLGTVRERSRSGLDAMNDDAAKRAGEARSAGRWRGVKEIREAREDVVRAPLKEVRNRIKELVDASNDPYPLSDRQQYTIFRAIRFWRGYFWAIRHGEIDPGDFWKVNKEIVKLARESADCYIGIVLRRCGTNRRLYDSLPKAEVQKMITWSYRDVPETYLTTRTRAKPREMSASAKRRASLPPAMRGKNDARKETLAEMKAELFKAAETLPVEEYDALILKMMGEKKRASKSHLLDFERVVRQADARLFDRMVSTLGFGAKFIEWRNAWRARNNEARKSR